MLDKIKQLMEFKKQAEQLKRELEIATVEVKEVPGISIVISGTQNFKSILIDPDVLKAENKEKFEMDLLRSINAAVKASQEMVAQKMKNSTGLNLPGM